MSLIGEVIERTPTSDSRFKSHFGSENEVKRVNGFPVVEHRSRSRFGRSEVRERERENGRRVDVPPVVGSSSTSSSKNGDMSKTLEQYVHPSLIPLYQQIFNHLLLSRLGQDDPTSILQSISQQNEDRVASMSDEQRIGELEEVREQLGSGIGDLMRRVREARERRERSERESVRVSVKEKEKGDDDDIGSRSPLSLLKVGAECGSDDMPSLEVAGPDGSGDAEEVNRAPKQIITSLKGSSFLIIVVVV